MIRLLLAAALGLVLASGSARAQDDPVPFQRYLYQGWSIEAGLPQISVNALAHDAAGTLWVGTENGLASFDGTEFEDRSADVRTLLGSAWITRLLRTRDGRMWIGTIRGVVLHDPGAGTGAVAVAGEHALGKVNALAERADDTVCVGADGLWCLDAGELRAVPGWSGPVTALLADGASLWIAGEGALVRTEPGHEDASVRLPPELAAARIDALQSDAGGLWVASTAGLWRVEGLEAQRLDLGTPVSAVGALALDASGSLWASGADSLWRIRDHRVIEHIDQRGLRRIGTVLTLLAEPDGSLWLGSLQNGLRRVWNAGPDRLGLGDGLPSLSVWAYWVDDEGLLAATDRGVAQLNGERFEPLVTSEQLPNPVAYSLLRDRARRLWVGTRGGLARFAPRAQPEAPFSELPTLQVNALLEARDASVWAGTSGGLYHFTGDGLRGVGKIDALGSLRVRALLEDRAGVLWAGTENGLFRDDGSGFRRVEDAAPGASFITTLLELPDARLLAGTYEGGLLVRDARGWWQLGSNELPSSTAFFLAEHADALLVGHPNGVFRIPLAALARDGTHPVPVEVLLQDLGKLPARARLRCCNGAGNGRGVLHAGHAWLASLGGAVRIPLGQGASAPPRVQLRSAAQDESELPLGERIVLPPGERDLTLRYGAVDFADSARLRYRYRLTGFNRGWVQAASRRTAWYTNLPAGSYLFEVQARHQYEAWGPAAQASVVVPPSLAERWPVRFAAGLVVVLLLALLLRLREARVRAQQLRLEATVEHRTLELREANSRLAALNEALAAASVTDPLTGLHNRRFIHEQIGTVVANLRRSRSRARTDLVIGVCVVDIDRFKSVNDDYGHAIGDRVLRRIALALRNEMRDGDYLLRWGGEEFVVITSESPRAHIPPIMERLRAAAGHSVPTPGEPARVTVSIGYSAYPLPGRELDDHDWLSAMNLADQALFGAKAAGRNRIATVELGIEARAGLPEHLSAAQLADWYASGRARLRIGLHGTVEIE